MKKLRDMVGLVPFLWLCLLFLLPFVIVIRISLSDIALSIPPYTPIFSWDQGWQGLNAFLTALDFENYRFLATDSLYLKAYFSSLKIATIATFFTLIFGYMMAYAMARAPRGWHLTLIMLVILPFWTSFLIRIYAWIGILSKQGLLNSALIYLGIISEPLALLNTPFAVYIGIVYAYFPFMVLPIYATLEKMDPSLLEAAYDLGCSKFSAFWRVTLPLSRSGVFAGCLLVFIPVLGEFVIPSLLGGSQTLMIGKVLWDEFFQNRDWPVASAVAVLLLCLLIVPILLFQNHQSHRGTKS